MSPTVPRTAGAVTITMACRFILSRHESASIRDGHR